MYGLVTFNYGKFGSELFYGSIISFWLFYHIVNLTFAIFCAIGRPLYRGSERFPVDEPMTIEVDNDSYQVRVCDISETGISFSSNLLLYLPKTKEITLHLQSRDYRARAKGHVVRVVVGEKCGATVCNLRKLIQLISVNFINTFTTVSITIYQHIRILG